jgi:hypothetical protein
MSKKTINVCDRHKKDIPAVGTFELRSTVNGRQGRSLKRDLCQACKSSMLGFFTSVVQRERKERVVLGPLAKLDKAEAKRARDRDRWHARKATVRPKSNGPNAHSPDYWPLMETKVMEAMNKLGQKVHIKDVMQLTELTESTTYNTLRRLVQQDKVTTTGGTGRYRRYSIPE